MIKRENEGLVLGLQSSLDEIHRQKQVHVDAIENLNKQEQDIIKEIDRLENE